ncbi:hypothetical protein V2J09_007220 [Rumex salicifolius]
MGSCGNINGDEVACNGFHMIRHNPLQLSRNRPLTWFDVRVFYVRICHHVVDDSIPELLDLNHFPLDPDTLLEVNGQRCSINSDGTSSVLRRDRLDKRSEEVTFVSTDNIRFTGSVKFQVFNREDLVLSGVLELCDSNDTDGELQNLEKRWSLRFESEAIAFSNFLKTQRNGSPESETPTIEVYVAGSFSGSPIILTKTLQLNNRKKSNRKSAMDVIPEHGMTETSKDPKSTKSLSSVTSRLGLQETEYTNYKLDDEEELNLYWRSQEYMEDEDNEVSWFNAGVRVGVGIGLGVCIGVGLGVGLLARTYQTTTRTFRRRLLLPVDSLNR